MESITPLIRVCVRYAFIAGVLGIALLVILYYIGKHPFLIPVYTDFRIILFGIFIFFSLKEYRDIQRGGLLYFWEGMIGSLVFVIAFAGIAALAIVAFAAIEENFVASYVRLTIEQIRSLPAEVMEKIGKEVVERNIEKLPDTTAFELSKLYVFQSFVIGFFISIIISVILRRQPKN